MQTSSGQINNTDVINMSRGQSNKSLLNPPRRHAIMPTRYLDPRVDIAFKRVFGEHAHLLRSLLNALLPLPEDGQI